MLVVLFFQCVSALLNPAHRRGEGIKWGLVSYTVAMFSLATVHTAMNLCVQSISFIDNREFVDAEGRLPPGPMGYRASIWSNALAVIPTVTYVLNNWLADSLLVCSLFNAAPTRPVV